MSKAISRKADINVLLDKCFEAYVNHGLTSCITELNSLILTRKVKFPILEYCADQFYEKLPQNIHIKFCDAIQCLKRKAEMSF